MASTDKPAPATEKAAGPPPEAPAMEVEKAVPPPAVPPKDFFVVADVILRLLLLAAAVTAVVVMVTSKQTEMVPLAVAPFQPVLRTSKFNHSAALIYFVAALSVAGLYSIITVLVSFYVLMKPNYPTKLVYHFLIFDVLMLGIVAAATGGGGAVAYVGLKGNSHVGWTKICNVYDKFCQYAAASLAISLLAAIVLALLIILSAYSLSKKIPK